MSTEAIGIVLSAATLVVIAATAIAAIVQLRHLRSGNQLGAVLTVMQEWSKPEMQAAYASFAHDLPSNLSDPEYVKEISTTQSVDRASHPEFLVFDFWEQIGTFAKHGLIDEGILLDVVAAQVQNAWQRGWPVIEIVRRYHGPAAAENFEYLAVRSKRWSEKYPQGTYPSGLPRMTEIDQ